MSAMEAKPECRRTMPGLPLLTRFGRSGHPSCDRRASSSSVPPQRPTSQPHHIRPRRFASDDIGQRRVATHPLDFAHESAKPIFVRLIAAIATASKPGKRTAAI